MAYRRILLAVAAGVTVVAAREEALGLRLPKLQTKGDAQDQSIAETGFGGGGGGGIENSKYFHYQHLPEHDKYEFGYRRGNDHHVKERYEKAVPHEGHFKTKVRWADKKGGHGEHYWDYNHAGHGGDDGEGGYSDPVPAYSASQAPSAGLKSPQKRQLAAESAHYTHKRPASEEADLRPQASRHYGKEAEPRPLASRHYAEEETQRRSYFEPKPEEAKLFGVPAQAQDRSEEGFVGTFEDEVGGVQNFEIQRDNGSKQKRNPEEPKRASKKVDGALFAAQRSGQEIQKSGQPQLYFDLETGKVIDENTGKTYLLQPYSS